VKKRQEALYLEDRNKKIRKSHENPEILKLYKEYIGEPFNETAHSLLHTHFEAREKI
jgi:NADH-quinone oxidoreductase subunit G/NADP-reducing hydrogenase subunit HndD